MLDYEVPVLNLFILGVGERYSVLKEQCTRGGEICHTVIITFKM
jgi:hypothetical protein